MTNKITVFAPATMANLAVGFDQLGLAINELGDTISVELINSKKITIECDNEQIPTDVEKNTAGKALLSFCEKISYKKGLNVSIKKGIPLGSGLGGSAASAVGAVVAANKLFNNVLSKEELLACALDGEAISGAAHFDNIAPCLYGGVTLISDERIFPINNKVDDLKILLIHPEIVIKTAESRELLPQEITLKDHVQQSGYLARFILALEKGDYKDLQLSCRDLIVEPKRQFLIKGFTSFKEYCKEENVSFSISGSGPTMFCLCNSKNIEKIKEKFHKIAQDFGYTYWIKEATINNKGAK